MKLFSLIVLTGISATLFIIAFFAKFEDPGWYHIALYVWSLIIGGAALWLFLTIIDDRRLDVEEVVARIDLIKDRELKRLDLFTRIPLPGWTYMIGERGLVIDTSTGHPITKVRLMFGEVPKNFIRGFIAGARDPDYVRAVRTYDEHETWDEDGGNCREYATICIRHIMAREYAGGQRNTPKKWTKNGRMQFQYESDLGIEDLNARRE